MTLIRLIPIVLSFFVLAPFANAQDWVPMQVADSGHLFIEIETNGKSGWALLDTGAAFNAISSEYLVEDEYSVSGRVRVTDAFGYRQMYREVSNVDIKMFGAELVFDEIVEIDTRDYAMILGKPFMDNVIFQLDYVNNRFRIFPRAAVDMADHANIVSIVDQDSGMPFVRVDINDEYRTWLLLDTGAPVMLLDMSFASRNSLVGDDVDELPTTVMSGLSSKNEVVELVLDEVKVGPFTIEYAAAAVPKNSDVTMQSRTRLGSRIPNPEAQGILGADILKHFVVTIDYRTGKIQLAPGQRVE